ncbi:unnamed protein product [Cuscuta epithymum]|uniref:Uncharacterized protein n=1 Tax=Cuscuta epithymum TaxID=186058 RepID=A0AAV0EE75_9ASTE|nr:unnamed protein product [Cuscuta epithymum]
MCTYTYCLAIWPRYYVDCADKDHNQIRDDAQNEPWSQGLGDEHLHPRGRVSKEDHQRPRARRRASSTPRAKGLGTNISIPEAECLKKTTKGQGLGDEHLPPQEPRAVDDHLLLRGRTSKEDHQEPKPEDEHPSPGGQSPGTNIHHPGAKGLGTNISIPEAECLKKTTKGQGLGDEHLPPQEPRAVDEHLSPRMPRARRRSSIAQRPKPGDEHPSPGGQSPGTNIHHPEAKARGRTSITRRPKPGDEHPSPGGQSPGTIIHHSEVEGLEETITAEGRETILISGRPLIADTIISRPASRLGVLSIFEDRFHPRSSWMTAVACFSQIGLSLSMLSYHVMFGLSARHFYLLKTGFIPALRG